MARSAARQVAQGFDVADNYIVQLYRLFATPEEVTEMEASFQTLGVNTMKTGSSTTAVRKQALHDLPLERLSNEARGKAESLLKNIGMFRRLPSLSFEVDPDVYGYFVRNPDVAVATWRAMDISKFNLQ